MFKFSVLMVFAGVFAGLPVALQGSQADMPDTRQRTFVYPKRVLWTSSQVKSSNEYALRCSVSGADKLLAPKFGQVSEGKFAAKPATILANRGMPPAILLDFGRELHGGLQIGLGNGGTPLSKLRLRFGESAAEAMSDIGEKQASNDHAMRDFVVSVPHFGAIEVGNTGFRFVRIDLITGGEVGLEFVRAISLMRPMKMLGTFSSSDKRLNEVFDTAVRTVHLCCQEYLWDGIKRDRLVWLGDMHPETTAILNVFGADPIIPSSLDYAIATTDPANAWMNSMAPYTLWFVRNLASWYRFTGDRQYLTRNADYLMKTLEHVRKNVSPTNDWAASEFLDWPTRHNPKAVHSGMQGLCASTFDDAAFLMGQLGNNGEQVKWHELADKFRAVKCNHFNTKSTAAVLALAGNIDPKVAYREVLGQNGHRNVSTFYGYYMLEAMSAAGENQRALDTIRDYWGGMLDVGATSFWENFDLAWTNNCFRIDELPVAGKKDVHGDYGEFCYPGFRHSLCHGWSCGPASWCINHVLGIRSLEVGCRTVEVKPFLGDLEWAEGAMALPDGNAVKVRVSKRNDGSLDVKVSAPDWVKIVR